MKWPRAEQRKKERKAAFGAIVMEYAAGLSEEEVSEKNTFFSAYFGAVEYEAMRDLLLNDGQRFDGRATMKFAPFGVKWITCQAPTAQASLRGVKPSR